MAVSPGLTVWPSGSSLIAGPCRSNSSDAEVDVYVTASSHGTTAANVPATDPAERNWNRSLACGAKPLINIARSVPSSVAVPLTTRRSNSVPAL